jgi:hypothetical protein
LKNLNATTVSVSIGPWNAQLGTAFWGNKFAMYQALTGVAIGVTGVTAIGITRIARHNPATTTLGAISLLITMANVSAQLARPKKELEI